MGAVKGQASDRWEDSDPLATEGSEVGTRYAVSRILPRVGARLLRHPRASTAVLLSICTFSSSAQTAAGRTEDMIERISPAAQELAKYQPGPEWQTTFHADETDLIQFVSEGRLLVGMMQLSPKVVAPRFGDIALYDTASGRRLWQTPRKPLAGGSYAVLVTEPVLVLQGLGPKHSYYLAVEPATGVVKWQRKVEAGHAAGISPDNELLILAQKRKSRGLAISALRLADGSTIWEQSVHRIDVSQFGGNSIAATHDGVFVGTGGVLKLDIQGGSVIWSVPTVSGIGPMSLLVQSDRLLLWDDAALYSLDLSSGEPHWEPLKVAGTISSMSAPASASRQGFITTRTAKKIGRMWSYSDVVHAVDLQQGRSTWSVPPVGHIQSGLLHASGRIYFTTSVPEIVALDASSGSKLLRVKMPLGGTRHLPAILLQRNGIIVVATEKGVAGLSEEKGQFIWHQRADYLHGSPFWFQTRHKVLAKYTEATEAGQQALQADARWWRNWTNSVQYQWSGYQPNPGRRASETGSFGNTMVAFQSVLSLSSMIRAGIAQSVLKGLVERLRLSVANSATIHAQCIQGDYYLRPYAKRGEGVMLVDLNTGKRADLVYSAPNNGMTLWTMRMPLFAVNPSSGHLLTTGLSLDTTSYERYTKGKVDMPYPSVFSFDLSSLKFCSRMRDDIEMVFAGGRGDIERIERLLNEGVWIDSTDASGETALIRAASKGHLQAVATLIASGASVSARDDNHTTALCKAAMNQHAGVVRLLIDAGADVNAVDRSGWTVLQAVTLEYKAFNKKDTSGVIDILRKAGAK